jgi:hypothetical protein
MKAILKFDLPDEKSDLEMAVHAAKAFCAIEDFKNIIRAKLKYADLTEEQSKVWEEVSDSFYETIADVPDCLK